MRLNQLSYLAAIEKYGTISRAAGALYISQPSISVAIRELEEELGYPLLERNSKGIRFTQAGSQVLEKAQLILREVENIHRIRREAEPLSGALRVGGTPHYCNSILLDVMFKLKEHFPGVHLYLEESDSEQILSAVENGTLQMGIVQLCDVDEAALEKRLDRNRLRFETLFEEEMCCVVGENHPLAGQAGPIPMTELLKYPYATYKQAMNGQVGKAIHQHGAADRVNQISEIVSLRRYIMRTDSYTVIPRRAVLYGNYVYQDKLIPLPVPELSTSTSTGLVHSGEPYTSLEEAVRALIVERCREYAE